MADPLPSEAITTNPSPDPGPAEQPAQPAPQIADANGAASAADKEWYRRKNHGGTGA